MHSKLSSRARLRAAALAVSAATLAFAVGGTGLAGAAVTPTGNSAQIKIELAKGKLKFSGPETVVAGDQLEIFNATNPKQVGPHTFSLVTKSSLPTTRKAQQSCFTPKKICFSIAKWHGFNPKTEKISVNLVKAGPAGWSTMGDNSGKKGDSWFTGEKKKGTHISQEVTAAPGSTLYYICAVHPEMQGAVTVEAPVVPLPTPTS